MSFRHSQLKNGLNLVSYSMNHLQTVSINLIVDAGSRDESSNEIGMAHFLEHMAFKGTSNRSARDIAEEFDSIGGQFNAYTSKEHTVYFAKILVEHTEKALDILSDIILNSSYANEDISKERNVINQEIAMTQDSPDELCYENLLATIFPNNPLGNSITGTIESISKFKSNDFTHFINKNYLSSRIVLSVAGNVDHDKTHNICEKLFSKLSTNKNEKTLSSEFNSATIIKDKDIEQSTVMIGFKSTDHKNLDEFYKTQILSLILGGGISSRLFQNIREKHGLAYSVGCFNSSYSDVGVFSLYASTAHDTLNSTIPKLKEETNKILDHITHEELDRAKSQVKALTVMAEEKNSFKSEEIGKNYLLFGKYISTNEVVEKVFSYNPNSIKEVANSIFSVKPSISILKNSKSQVSEKLW